MGDGARKAADALERGLEAERDQLALWLPVMLGGGIAVWFVLPDRTAWTVALLGALGVALTAAAIGRHGRAARVLAVGALVVALGIGLIWWRATQVGHVVLQSPSIGTFTATVERIEPLPARDLVRLRLAPVAVFRRAGSDRPPPALPRRLRLNLAVGDVPAGLAVGVTLRLTARLLPPPEPSVPGAYNYAVGAWFDRIGATGRGLPPVTIVAGARATGIPLRQRLSAHIQVSAGGGGAGGIATALATGEQGSIPLDDTEAMRRSGLAHLLSVSGLHISATVAATMILVSRLLALSPWLALRWRLPLVAGAAGALVAIGYTLLTGAEVPTIRSCVAALCVLIALALGREALTLRLVAAGAIVVLLLYPESLVGPSFQLSFAAVASIIALNEHPRIRAQFAAREEPRLRSVARSLASLLLTGIMVEAALLPISLYHFQKAGIYGAVANICAIPLTTFVIMPLEAAALLFDLIGAGAPLWWATRLALDVLLWIARTTAAIPGSVAPLPAMPDGAFGLMVAGGLWIALWRTRWRRLGVGPLAIGAVWALSTPAPDLLVTGDGRHVAIRTKDGAVALLRDRTGDYTADMMAQGGGTTGLPVLWSDQRSARCSRDLCMATSLVGDRRWQVLATRSAYAIPVQTLVEVCARADIVISERRLPKRCHPRWLRLDRTMLAQTGGVAITFYPSVLSLPATASIRTVRRARDEHPWITVPQPLPQAARGTGRRFRHPRTAPDQS
ncbi:ComEC/Rec2 family competence protein [Sphingomonas sp. PAMC 26617]|uniref:ComEC/Rec2 family competence protein n=1 Tax=Sphingomonas sp. PAMC 26617 TaxID=1112216 RepID=UPI000288359C|nr:ComEC/Rec2 family competence protein [Sphingomonas sp. PAMC 26617]